MNENHELLQQCHELRAKKSIRNTLAFLGRHEADGCDGGDNQDDDDDDERTNMALVTTNTPCPVIPDF